MTYAPDSWTVKLRADLELDEGIRLNPYTDTVGKTTIGIGRNLNDVGISMDEARFLLGNDISVATREMDKNIPWWRDLPPGAKRGLVNMCFNLGWPGLSKFKNMLTALRVGSYEIAANEALDSNWAEQVGARAHRIAKLFRDADKT